VTVAPTGGTGTTNTKGTGTDTTKKYTPFDKLSDYASQFLRLDRSSSGQTSKEN